MIENIEKIGDDLYEVSGCKGTSYVHAADKYEAAAEYRRQLNEEN